MESGKEEPSSSAVEEARALLQRKLPAEAARLLERHLADSAGSASEYLLLGVARAQSGEGLTAIQALEQAIAIEPGNAAAHFNLAQVYRQGGRMQEALGALERALELRPNYPAAQTAAAEIRQRLAPPPPPGQVSPSFEPPPRRGGTAWPPTFAPGPSPVPTAAPAVSEKRGVYRRLLAAAWQIIVSPSEAVNYGLDNFFNTPGAIRAVYNFFSLSLLVWVLLAWLLPDDAPQAESPDLMSSIPFVLIFGVVSVIATAGTIAGYNRITGETDDFIGDFGSLALSFAMIGGTITLLLSPIQLVLTLSGSAGAAAMLMLIGGIWTLILRVTLVMAMSGIGAFAAYILLGVASAVGGLVAAVVAALFSGAG